MLIALNTQCIAEYTEYLLSHTSVNNTTDSDLMCRIKDGFHSLHMSMYAYLVFCVHCSRKTPRYGGFLFVCFVSLFSFSSFEECCALITLQLLP